MLTDLLVQPVTVTHRSAGTGKGAYGNKTVTTSTTETVGRLARQKSRELGVGVDLSVSAWVLYLPPGVTIGHRDRVEVDGATYEVNGEPYVVPSGTGPHHLEVPVSRVDV